MFSSHNILFRQNVEGYDFRYQAVINKALALGYTLPSQQVQIEQNRLVKSMVAGGVWDQYDLWYNFLHDGSESFGFLNWINPDSNLITKSGTVTFTPMDGSKGNGTNGYYNTNTALSVCTHYLRDSASFMVDIKENTQNATEFIWASQGGLNLSGFRPRTTGDQYNIVINALQGTTAIGSTTTSAGLWYSQRSNSTTISTYLDGVLLGTLGSLASASVTSANVVLFARNDGGSIVQFSSKTVRCFGIGGLINPTLMNTYWDYYKNAI